MLSTGISDSSDATFLTADSSENATFAGNLTVSGNLTVTGTTTQVDTVTMNAQNAVLFEGATADAHETTLTTVDPTGDRTISLPNVSGTLPVLAAASVTQITSTPEELNLLDGSSANTVVNSKAVIYGSSGELAGTLSTAAQTNITSVGTLTGFTSTGIDDNASSTAITIGSDGNVGIGLTPRSDWRSQTTALQISPLGTIYNDSSYEDFNLGNNVYTDSGGEKYIQDDGACKIRLTDAGLMDFRTAASGSADASITWNTALSITNDGKVGVNNTDNFDRTFTIGTGTAKTSTTTVYPFAIQTNEASGAARLSMHYVGGASAAARKIMFQMEEEGVANAGDIVLNPYGGEVGIGRTPSQSNTKLEVGGADNVPIIAAEASGAFAGLGVGSSKGKLYYGTTEACSFAVGDFYAGNIRLNGTSSNSQIEAGNVHFKVASGIWMSGSGSLDLQLQVPVTGVGISTAAKLDAPTGDWFTNDGSVSSLSDSRLKTNINTLKDGLDIVNKLRPVTFQYNDTTVEDDGSKGLATANDTTRYGFIAQEVEEAAPHYVNSREGKIKGETVSDLKSTSMTRMIPMLVKSIQDLSQKLAERNQEVTNLENRIETIEQRLI